MRTPQEVSQVDKVFAYQYDVHRFRSRSIISYEVLNTEMLCSEEDCLLFLNFTDVEPYWLIRMDAAIDHTLGWILASECVVDSGTGLLGPCMPLVICVHSMGNVN